MQSYELIWEKVTMIVLLTIILFCVSFYRGAFS